MSVIKKSDYKSKYKGVSLLVCRKVDTKVWRGNLGKKQKYFDNEKDAAKWVDLRLIEQGKEPVNILVRK
jgi:hypothetical protein